MAGGEGRDQARLRESRGLRAKSSSAPTHGEETIAFALGRRLGLAALGGSFGKGLVHVVEVFLQAFLDLIFERGELNSHSHCRITGADASLGEELLGVDPEGDIHIGIDCERDQALYIASPAANIGRVTLHVGAPCVGKADHNRELNSMAHKATLV